MGPNASRQHRTLSSSNSVEHYDEPASGILKERGTQERQPPAGYNRIRVRARASRALAKRQQGESDQEACLAFYPPSARKPTRKPCARKARCPSVLRGKWSLDLEVGGAQAAVGSLPQLRRAKWPKAVHRRMPKIERANREELPPPDVSEKEKGIQAWCTLGIFWGLL